MKKNLSLIFFLLLSCMPYMQSKTVKSKIFCISNHDCSAPQHCFLGLCTSLCYGSKQCPKGYFCNMPSPGEKGECQKGCGSNADCSSCSCITCPKIGILKKLCPVHKECSCPKKFIDCLSRKVTHILEANGIVLAAEAAYCLAVDIWQVVTTEFIPIPGEPAISVSAFIGIWALCMAKYAIPVALATTLGSAFIDNLPECFKEGLLY